MMDWSKEVFAIVKKDHLKSKRSEQTRYESIDFSYDFETQDNVVFKTKISGKNNKIVFRKRGKFGLIHDEYEAKTKEGYINGLKDFLNKSDDIIQQAQKLINISYDMIRDEQGNISYLTAAREKLAKLEKGD